MSRSRPSARPFRAFRTSFRPVLDLLEARDLLSANYLPQSCMLVNPNGLLTSPQEGHPLDIALRYISDHAAELGLTVADLRDPIVTSQYTDEDSGATHIYLRQQVNGLEVAYADLAVTVDALGEVVSAGGGFVPGLAAQMAGTDPAPTMTAVEAVRVAANSLGLTPDGDPQVIWTGYGPGSTTIISAPGVSLDDIAAQLHYVPTEDGGATLAWELVIRTPDGGHWYDLSIDGSQGEMIAANDWIHHDSYNVVPPPNESPQDGGFSVQLNPADPTASPFGWHDTNGTTGAEFTDTRGNNVDAHLDRNNDNIPDADQGGGHP